MTRAIRKLLIANRGEIARRVRRTATEMGITSVAVYTKEELGAPHVLEMDEAFLLEGSGPQPYLDIAGLVDVAKRSGSDAVHPGYGFLAESKDFAQAVIAAGLAWVGPPPDAIARMADKIESKRTAREAGVPTLDETTESMPALVKAAAGGGGKGMRVVWSYDKLNEAIDAARREALHAFGDDRIFVEPYLPSVRHVEIQVLGDAHWNLIHLGERECSIQRRHQKVVEESPSVAVGAELRSRMGEAAVALARSIGYRSAGTVEFLLDPEGNFWFMEMNTRLQVEHPVTEVVYGVDIVREQLLDAMEEPLSMTHGEPIGHAIEVRLNAEDPANNDLPATGTIVGWHPSDGVRVESGVATGSVVTTSFDPLLAKFVAHARTRDEAASTLALALERSTIQGVQTNRDVLVAILRHPMFVKGDTPTNFLEHAQPAKSRELSAGEREAALAAVALQSEIEERRGARVLTTFPPGWRNSRMPPQRRILAVGDEESIVEYQRDRDGNVTVNGSSARYEHGVVEVQGRTLPVQLNRTDGSWWVHGPWGDVEVVERSPFPSSEVEEASGSLHAPMPGSVVSVAVKVGDEVKKGQTLVVLEAMKMEHPIACPEDGVVSEVKVSAGEQVERGALLVVVEGAESD